MDSERRQQQLPHNNTATLDEEAFAQQHTDLYNSLIPLLRTKPDHLNAYLEEVACNAAIPNTYAQAHCYFVALDGNKRPRVNDFAILVQYHFHP